MRMNPIKQREPDNRMEIGIMREKAEEYQKFVEELKEEMYRLTEGKNITVVFQPALDEFSEDYLVAKTDGKNGKHVQRFHTEEMFRDLENGEMDMEEILSSVSEMLDYCGEVEKISPLEEIDNYEKISSRLIVRPLNYEAHVKLLDVGIYDRIGDIALALYISIGTVKGHYASSLVPLRVFSNWGQKKEEVMKKALKNTYDLFPPIVFDLYRLGDSKEEMCYTFMEKKTLPADTEGSGGIFITNTAQLNGAVSLFLPGVAKKLGELLNSDYYIAFTSMHEAAIHKTGTVEVEGIRSSLQELNKELDIKEDFLTEQVYKYSRVEDKIVMVEWIPGCEL